MGTGRLLGATEGHWEHWGALKGTGRELGGQWGSLGDTKGHWEQRGAPEDTGSTGGHWEGIGGGALKAMQGSVVPTAEAGRTPAEVASPTRAARRRHRAAPRWSAMAEEEEEAVAALPQKRFYRQRAHSNPLADRALWQ